MKEMKEWQKECTCFSCGSRILVSELCSDCADVHPNRIRHNHSHTMKRKPGMIIGSVLLEKSSIMSEKTEVWWEVLNPWAYEEYLVLTDNGDAWLKSSGSASHKTYLELRTVFPRLRKGDL